MPNASIDTSTTSVTPTEVQGTTLTLDGKDAANRTIVLSQGGRLILNGIVPESLSIEFTDGTGALVINDSQHFGATVSGFGKGDSIVFANEFASWAEYSQDRIMVSTGKGGTEIANFPLNHHTGPGSSHLFLSRDGNGNSILVRSTERDWAGGDGDWYSAADWTATNGSTGYPGTGDTAVIGSGTVSIAAGGMTVLNNEHIELTGSNATLQIADGTLGAGLTISAKSSSDALSPRLSLLGQTTLDGVVTVKGKQADLHLAVGDDGTGAAGLLTVSAQGVVSVVSSGILHIDAGAVRNDGLIAVSGRLALEAGASLDGSGTVSVHHGTFEAKGEVGSGIHVDLSRSHDLEYGQCRSSLITIKDVSSFNAVIDDFGTGDTIDLEGIKVGSVSFDAGTGTLHLLDGSGADLGTLNVSGAHEANDFRLSSDEHGGTFVTGRAGTDALNRVATTFLPTPVRLAIGGSVTLQQLLVDAFGSDVSQKLGQVLVSSDSGSDLDWASYWDLAAPTVASWTTGGVAVPADTVRTINAADWSSTVLTAGSAIQATAQVLLPSAWSNGTVTGYTAYNIETIDPAFVRPGTAAPTAADIVGAAETLSDAYSGTPNSEDCYNIAAQVGAAAGATFSNAMWSRDPGVNRAGGYWRIAYTASDSANPVSNWSGLVQAGDVMRVGWSGEPDGKHSFTILDGLHEGVITVLDNVYSTPGLSTSDESQIGIHDVSYWTETDPAAISIFRLDPNGKFLVLGSALMGGTAVDGETLRGSGKDDLFIPGEHATTLELGGGTDMIADRAENLDGSTVDGLVNGDSIDITDLGRAGTTASYDPVSGTLVVRSGGRTVTIGLDKGLTGQFTLAGDGGRQGLDGGTLGDIYDSLYTAGDEGLRLTFNAAAPLTPAVSLPGGRGGAIDLDALRLDGTGDAGTTIGATLSGQAAGTATVGSGGTWSLVLSSPIPLGGSTLTLTETNGEGVTSAAATLVIARDTSGSAIQLASGDKAVAATYGADGRLAALTGGPAGQSAETDAAALFDPAWYLAENPDVAAAGTDPYQHFVQFGWHEGRSPSALFSTAFYLNQNPDVAAAGVDPLLHYAASGWHENRDPSSLFSTSGYLALHPGVAGLGLDPLLHYEEIGKAEGLATEAAIPHTTAPQDPLVDAATLYAQRPDLVAAGLDPTTWYGANGATTPVNPDPLFDAAFYLRQNPDVAAAGVNPLLHYEANGWLENRDPSLLFSNSRYLQANPDVAAAGMNPLQHYLTFGQHEGRMAFLSGDSVAADPLVDATYYDKQLGATLLPSGAAASMQATASYDATGWKQGLNPDTLFNTSYYLSHNPDVAAAGLNPLLHFEQWGWHEGRNASGAFDTNAYLQHNPDVAAAGMDPLAHYVTFGAAEGRAIYAVS